MGHEGEASVEEILESIKKVIARDNRAGAIEARRRRMLVSEDDSAEPAPLARTHTVRDADEVLDLSEMELEAGSHSHAQAQTPAQTAAGSPPSTATLLNGVRGAERAASATAGADAAGDQLAELAQDELHHVRAIARVEFVVLIDLDHHRADVGQTLRQPVGGIARTLLPGARHGGHRRHRRP